MDAPIQTEDSLRAAHLEADAWRGKSFQEHYEGFEAAVLLAFAALDQSPHKEKILAYQEPLPADSRANLERLKREFADRS